MTTPSVDRQAIEQGDRFLPRFDAQGLVAGVVTHARTGRLLMVAWMNADAIERTQVTGFAHFWSRSRQSLWMKGETSGNRLKITEIRVDCDQDALELRVEPEGPACHTGAGSCFYRKLEHGRLERD